MFPIESGPCLLAVDVPGKVLVSVLDGEAHARVGQELGLREEALGAALLGEQELHLAQGAAVLQQLHGKNLALSRNLIIALVNPSALFHDPC